MYICTAVCLPVALLLMLTVDQSESGVTHGIGCPDGHKPGDKWYPAGRCEMCECAPHIFFCSSCGSAAIDIDDPLRCYQDFGQTLQYPGCCKPKVVCEGDQGFDVNKLLEFK